jgi:hypothetical protein
MQSAGNFRARHIRAKNHAAKKFLCLPFAKPISAATFNFNQAPIPASKDAAMSTAAFINIRKEIT